MLKHTRCFLCGPQRPILTPSVQFEPIDGSQCRGICEISDDYQSYDGIVHGGIVSTLLDAAMNQVLLAKNIQAFTAELKVRFLAPVLVSCPLEIVGRLLKQRRHAFWLEGIVSQNGIELARAQAIFMRPVNLSVN